MPVQNFWAFPEKNLGAKNMQNLVRFRTTSKFDGKYLQSGWRYSKLDKYILYHDSSHVRRKKFGEVWSTNFGDVEVESYPLKSTFGISYFSP